MTGARMDTTTNTYVAEKVVARLLMHEQTAGGAATDDGLAGAIRLALEAQIRTYVERDLPGRDVLRIDHGAVEYTVQYEGFDEEGNLVVFETPRHWATLVSKVWVTPIDNSESSC
jgi:hypothetical protein